MFEDGVEHILDQESESRIIRKEILTPGTSRISKKPIEGSKCVMKIENIKGINHRWIKTSGSVIVDGLLEECNSFTAGLENDEVTMIIGEANCELDIRIERAVQLMKDGERARITIALPKKHDELAEVCFEATLMKHDRFKPIWEWTPEEKYEIAMKYKNMGVQLFKNSEDREEGRHRRFRDAFYRFSRACKILITLEPIDDLGLDKTLYDNILALRLKLYNNMAACQGKHHNYYYVIELCSKVLAKNDKNVLALFRRGYAYGELKDYERSVQDFRTLISIEPEYPEAKSKLAHYTYCLKEANKRCNEMVKRMFKI